MLVDRLAAGLAERGDQVTLLCGGPVADRRPYRVHRAGGSYSQFARVPIVLRRRAADCDLVVEVCNGMPFLVPLWTRRPALCLVNHVHTQLWSLRFRWPVAAAGQFLESVAMPWAHRRNLFLTVSASTSAALRGLGVGADRIRVISNGVEPAPPPAPRSPEPLFLALGRLAPYKRIDLLLRIWNRVRPVTGGRLVIAGDGPERDRLRALAGPGVEFTGRVPEDVKHRLLSAAWLLLHPASVEGWGIVVTEAALRGTPAVGFRVPGLRDSVVAGRTGLLAGTETEFASAWASLAIDHRTRAAMGRAARDRAMGLHWSAAVDGFSAVADEVIAMAGGPGRSPSRCQAPAGSPGQEAVPVPAGPGVPPGGPGPWPPR